MSKTQESNNVSRRRFLKLSSTGAIVVVVAGVGAFLALQPAPQPTPRPAPATPSPTPAPAAPRPPSPTPAATPSPSPAPTTPRPPPPPPAAPAPTTPAGPPKPSGTPVKIGVTVAQSGPFGGDGTDQVMGMRLAADDVNAKGGVLGRPLELVVYDDEGKTERGLANAERLMAVDNVDAMIAGYLSDIQTVIAPKSEERRTPNIAGYATIDPLWTRGWKYQFCLPPITSRWFVDSYAEGAANLFKPTPTKIAAVNRPILAGPFGIDPALEYLRSLGVQVVAREVIPWEVSDLTPVLRKLKSANPDLVLSVGDEGMAVGFIKQMKEVGWKPKAFCHGWGTENPRWGKEVKDLADYTYATPEWSENLRGPRYPGIEAFIAAFRKKYPDKTITQYTALGYADVSVFAQAIQKAGTTDKTKVRDVMASATFGTPYGIVKFETYDFAGKTYTNVNTGATYYLGQWKPGSKLDIVWPRDVATGPAVYPWP